MDAASRDITFKQSDETLRISEAILGARVIPEQKKILENHRMVFIENMRNPRTKQLFFDDVRPSNKSNNLLIGKNAYECTNRNSLRGRRRKPSKKQSATWPHLKRRPVRVYFPLVNPQTVIHTIYPIGLMRIRYIFLIIYTYG